MGIQIMNQIAEDQTTDDEIAMPKRGGELHISRSEFTRPSYSFKGVELFPFTYGYELLFNQVRDAEDTGLYTWFAFVFLLLRRGKEETSNIHKAWAISTAWKVDNFRTALTDWMDENGPFTNEDKLEAKRIYEENMKAIADTTVEPVPVRGKTSQKKTSHQKKQQSSMSSAES